jgi:hypothetical protein
MSFDPNDGISSVSKSYVPGVGWKSASKLTAIQRAKVPGAQAKMHRVKPADRSFARTQRNLAGAIKSDPETRSALGGVKKDPESWVNQAYTIRTGSAKRGKSYIAGQAQPRHFKQLVDHENEHAKIKRSSYRLHSQIMGNPQKLLREEARADFHSKGHYSNNSNQSVYAQTARWREKALKHPNRPAKGSGPQQRIMREYDPGFKRNTNQSAYEGSAQQNFGQVGYKMSGKSRDKSVDAYRSLQDRLRDKKVKKSYVPGKGFIPASAIPKAELRALAHGGRKAGQRIVRAKAKADNDTFKSTHADLKKLAQELQTKGRTSRTPSGALHHSVSNLDINTYSPGTQAFAFKTGGRRAPGYLVTAPGASGHIMAHEAAHLMPKRSAYRTHHQLVEDGAKSMREEARADMASGDKSGYYANREAKRTKSGYVEAANSEYARSTQYRHSDEHRAKMFTPESMDAFRSTQDRIHANRGPNYKFKGNQYVDEAGNKKARNHQLLVNGATAAGVAGLYGAGATIAYRRHKAKKEALAKNFTPWDGITSEVSKMGPDQSELHVVGNSGQKKKLRKIPPSDIRRVQ